MLAVLLISAMRPHLKDVWRKAAFNAADINDRNEPMSYRAAVIGLVVAYVGMYLWLTLVGEVQPQLAVAVLSMTLAIFVALSWLVAQGGLLFIHHAFSTTQTMTVIEGTQAFSPPSLATSMIAEHVGWQDAREFMLPSLLNSQKAAAEMGISSRTLTRAIAVCVVLAVVVSGAASIWLPYTHGGGTSLRNGWAYISSPQLPYEWSASLTQGGGHAMSPSGVLNIVAGALLVLVMSYCRTQFPWFQLHPAGFLAAGTWAMYTLWFSLLLGWIGKSCILRFGGMHLYRKLMPLFLGLIMGDCLSAIVWTVVGLITHTGYMLLPN